MSKFSDKLQQLSESSVPPIGFHPTVNESKSSAMLLIVGLSGADVEEAKVAADIKADAVLILNQSFNTKLIKQMVKAVGDIPLGVFVKGISEKKMSKLTSSGCDFIVFDVKMPAIALQEETIGKFLTVEPSFEPGLLRAINSLEVDGVFINRSEESFVTVEHLLIWQRFCDLLSKPLVVTLSSSITSAELSNLWQIGIDCVVTPSAQSEEALSELRSMIDHLPKETKRRPGKAGVILPHYGGDVTIEEEEEEEEEEI
ncbi:MAG: hypothetical protein JW732_10110 [Dehalococcoidia bacterium]|nr:hypothetical protein [Dehalococcoidia bacterium]